MDSEETPSKRDRVSPSPSNNKREIEGVENNTFVLKSMSTPVSPPRKRRRGQGELGERVLVSAATEAAFNERNEQTTEPSRPTLKSPFRLTAIHDLPASANIDTVTVRDIFGDPRVIECWEFNFLHDLDFLMSSFDDGARQRGLNVHVVHGFWKREDPRREQLETAARQYSKDSSQNGGTITLHTAYMPEPFGTHHTKMAVLLRSDDTAQVIIHTANLIPHDWCNMTQAVWRSPLLPLLTSGKTEVKYKEESGVGLRFKYDFLNYLSSYNQRRSVCSPLVEALQKYDFSAVRAVLIGSVPGRHHIPSPEDEVEERDRQNLTAGDEGCIAHTRWGWLAMKQALKNVPQLSQQAKPGQSSPDEIVIQVSSIATLGGTDVWLQKTLFPALSSGKATSKSTPKPSRQAISFGPLRQPQERPPPKPIFRVMFPTADEIRRSLEGYVSGSSIHAKIQSPQQQKQLAYMRPMMCHWANDSEDGEAITSETGDGKRCAGDAKRRRAAPHVKTYVRYSNCHDGCYIDWALLTSANLSKQAWGEARSAAGEIRIASYELGVLVWPELLTEIPGATMQPVFGRDDFKPDAPSTGEQIGQEVREDSALIPAASYRSSISAEGTQDADGLPNVPLRIPYSLPLQRYGANEIPWVTSLPHIEPDWRGNTAIRWED